LNSRKRRFNSDLDRGVSDLIAEWKPDLAILDVVLPVMNGIDLANLLKAQYPTGRVLLFSGATRTTELMAEAAQKGCNFEILAKPVHPTVMLEAAIKMLVAE
jgi:CheY-like chemotaxis protein